MLWYKAWLETRWRFLIGLAIVTLLAAFTVRAYPELMRLAGAAGMFDPDTPLGRQIAEGIALASTFKGYIWSQWFLKNLPQTWTLFAALLGAGGLLSQSHRGEGLFMLSLPVSRARIAAVRAATCLGELFVIALVPSLLIPILAPGVGHSYGLADTLVHAVCLFAAGTVFFSLSFLLSTVFADVWRPFLIVACLGLLEQTIRDYAKVGVFRLMSAESYFRGDGIPWLGILGAVAVSAAMLYAAAKQIERLDF
jgi:ABC-2 type transport system permease protein